MLPNSLRNFEMQNYCQIKPIWNGIFSENDLLKIKDGGYLRNLDEFKSIGIHWIAIYTSVNNILYLDRYGVENIPKEIKSL